MSLVLLRIEVEVKKSKSGSLLPSADAEKKQVRAFHSNEQICASGNDCTAQWSGGGKLIIWLLCFNGFFRSCIESPRSNLALLVYKIFLQRTSKLALAGLFCHFWTQNSNIGTRSGNRVTERTMPKVRPTYGKTLGIVRSVTRLPHLGVIVDFMSG